MRWSNNEIGETKNEKQKMNQVGIIFYLFKNISYSRVKYITHT